MESKRTVFKCSKKCLQLPPRRQYAWKENTIVLSCSKAADTKYRKKTFERKVSEVVVLVEGGIRKCADVSFKRKLYESVILPCVKTESGCKFGEKCAYSGTLRLTVSQAESRRKVVEKDLILQRYITPRKTSGKKWSVPRCDSARRTS